MCLFVYTDSDFASKKDRKSSNNYELQVYRSTVFWATKKQTTVALLSTEAEYIPLATVSVETACSCMMYTSLWQMRLL